MKKNTKLAMAAGMGLGAFMLYKKYNPNIMKDMKTLAKNMINDMDMD